MITTDKFIEIFGIADNFYKKYEFEIHKTAICESNDVKTRNRNIRLSPSEIITILVCFHFGLNDLFSSTVFKVRQLIESFFNWFNEKTENQRAMKA